MRGKPPSDSQTLGLARLFLWSAPAKACSTFDVTCRVLRCWRAGVGVRAAVPPGARRW